MKVLHVESGRHLYGGPRQVLLLLRGLRARGVENVLACPVDSAIAAADPAAEVRQMVMRGDLDVTLPLRLRRLYRALRPDLVHLHSRRGADWIGGLAARRLGVPVVLSRRVDNPEWRPVAVAKYALFDRVIAISAGIRQVLIDSGVPEHKVVCVRSAVPEMQRYGRDRQWLREEFGVPGDRTAIGVIAQLIVRKGHDVLLDALASLVPDHPNLNVLFFGRGPQRAALDRRISALGLDDVVTLAGFRDDLERILPSLDIVVHPALREGLGVSLLQASAAGLPVIASRAGGIPEAVVDGETGYLVPPGDPSALAGALRQILQQPDLGRAMGRRGARYVTEAFGADAMVEGNLAVYRAVLGSG